MRRANRWTGGPAVGIAVVAMTLLTASPRDLSAQDSQFGIRGLGTPGRWESVRSRSSGGAFAPFDALSPLMEAPRSEEHTSELQSHSDLVCRLLLEKKKQP